MTDIFQNPEPAAIESLLLANNLPTDDLANLNFQHFFGCGVGNSLKGVIGLEVYGTDGMLRSLAVASDTRRVLRC